MNQQQMATELRKAEQRNGELMHKLKQRKEDKNIFNTELGKLKKQNASIRSDLNLAYENLEMYARNLIALKRVFRIVNMTKEENDNILQIFNEAKKGIQAPVKEAQA